MFLLSLIAHRHFEPIEQNSDYITHTKDIFKSPALTHRENRVANYDGSNTAFEPVKTAHPHNHVYPFDFEECLLKECIRRR
ncbi:MAG: hypothetical protein ABIL39_10875 [candidate division WOR-3 bacterium]